MRSSSSESPIPSPSPWLLTEGSLDTLKLWALLLMTLDHINQALLGGGYASLTYLGRGAYPLFCFAMACHLIRKDPMNRYLRRIMAYALLSQPFYLLAFDEPQINILFILCFTALISRWLLEQSPMWQHLILGLSLVSFVLKDPFDYDLVGLVFPVALVMVLQGRRIGWFWCVLLAMFLNIDLGHLLSYDEGVWSVTFPVADFCWTTAGALVLPIVAYRSSCAIRTRRYLPRLTFYVYYPAHLALLSLLRLGMGKWPWEIFSIS